MAGREDAVKGALEGPDEVRASRTDRQVLLFYRSESAKRWTCAVVKRADDAWFLITSYPTEAIKEGIRVWPN